MELLELMPDRDGLQPRMAPLQRAHLLPRGQFLDAVFEPESFPLGQGGTDRYRYYRQAGTGVAGAAPGVVGRQPPAEIVGDPAIKRAVSTAQKVYEPVPMILIQDFTCCFLPSIPTARRISFPRSRVRGLVPRMVRSSRSVG